MIRGTRRRERKRAAQQASHKRQNSLWVCWFGIGLGCMMVLIALVDGASVMLEYSLYASLAIAVISLGSAQIMWRKELSILNPEQVNLSHGQVHSSAYASAPAKASKGRSHVKAAHIKELASS